MSQVLRVLGVLFLMLSASLLSACSPPSSDAASSMAIEDVVLGGETFHLKVAGTDALRQKGLGGVAALAADEGMIFIFPDAAPRSFWMLGCVIDLDIAYVSPLGRVVSVYTMPKEPLQAADESADAYATRLTRYPSLSPARYVIEVAPGTFARLGIKTGSMLELDREHLKTLAH